MKLHKQLVTILFMLLVFLPCALTVRAASQSELVTQAEDSLDISVLHQEGEDRLIKCFDANADGFYAVGFANNTIYIYDASGVFQYGYRFHTDGTYGIELKENSIVIYLARSNMAVEINPDGQCLNAEEVHNTYHILNRTEKEMGNVRYYLDRDVGIFNRDYSRLVRVVDGEEVVLYDVTTQGYFAGIFHYIVIAIFPIGIIAIIVTKVKKEEKGQ